MKTLDFIVQAFGFAGIENFKLSTFGFMSHKIVSLSMLVAVIKSFFGVNHAFVFAYVALIIFEWFTGVMASLKRGEKHESRKLGRMILKLAVYCVPIAILNTFSKHSQFPSVNGYELDPFLWLYWTVLLVVIWQLTVSLLENLESLGFKWAKLLLRILNKRFYKQFDIDNN
ncbi:phage holin family protein [Wenyingzhuangia sp. IMCC45574]